MKGISRRSFLKYCIGSAAALGLDLSVVARLHQALAADGTGLPTVVWLNGANCTGCTVSLANRIADDGPTDVADLLIHYINLAFHPNLMGAAGDLAVATLNEAVSGPFILAVDGGIPTAFDGHTCMLWSENGREITAKEAVETLAPRSAALLAVGTCASFGGIPAAGPNPTGITTVEALTGVPAINLPGCPTHPDWIVWTVAQLLAGAVPELDEDSRPAQFFAGDQNVVHKTCPRKGTDEVDVFGMEGRCLKELGCRGPKAHGDCVSRMWNNGTSWCIGVNAPCIACTEKGFPDAFSPFFRKGFEEGGPQEPVEDPGAETDTVSVASVQYDPTAGTLTVVATSSNQPEAVLTADGYGQLDWKSWKNFYRNTFTGVAERPASVTVSSSGGGSAVFTLDPVDTVTVQSISYDAGAGTLSVVATSSNQPEAVLTADGYGQLDWKSWKNFYRNTFTGVSEKPSAVTVSSSAGGTATFALEPSDTVTISRAEYDESRQALLVIATSSRQPDVRLDVEGHGGLDWKSWLGFYRNTFFGVGEKPAAITVTSSGGGTSTTGL